MESYSKKKENSSNPANLPFSKIEGNYVFCNVLSGIFMSKILRKGIFLIKNRDKFLERKSIQNVARKESELCGKLISFCCKFGDMNKSDFRRIECEEQEENEYIQLFLKTKRLHKKKKFKSFFSYFKTKFHNEVKSLHCTNEKREKSYSIHYLSDEKEEENKQNNEQILRNNSTQILMNNSHLQIGRSSSIGIDTSIDFLNLPKCIKIVGKNIIYIDRKKGLKKELIFVFSNLNLKLIEDNEVEWKVKIVKLAKWLGFGIGNKVNFHSTHKFQSDERVNLNLSNPCCLSVTTGGILWNYLDPSKNFDKIKNFPKEVKENDTFRLIYRKNNLRIKYNDSYSYDIEIPGFCYSDSKINFFPYIVLNPGCEISLS
jgi:hypothetical protein